MRRSRSTFGHCSPSCSLRRMPVSMANAHEMREQGVPGSAACGEQSLLLSALKAPVPRAPLGWPAHESAGICRQVDVPFPPRRVDRMGENVEFRGLRSHRRRLSLAHRGKLPGVELVSAGRASFYRRFASVPVGRRDGLSLSRRRRVSRWSPHHHPTSGVSPRLPHRHCPKTVPKGLKSNHSESNSDPGDFLDPCSADISEWWAVLGSNRWPLPCEGTARKVVFWPAEPANRCVPPKLVSAGRQAVSRVIARS
jgi:hypothetical protein